MSNVIAFVRDSLTSLVSRMGTDRDKAATTFYTHTILSDEQLIASYSSSWLPRKIVDIPAWMRAVSGAIGRRRSRRSKPLRAKRTV